MAVESHPVASKNDQYPSFDLYDRGVRGPPTVQGPSILNRILKIYRETTASNFHPFSVPWRNVASCHRMQKVTFHARLYVCVYVIHTHAWINAGTYTTRKAKKRLEEHGGWEQAGHFNKLTVINRMRYIPARAHAYLHVSPTYIVSMYIHSSPESYSQR